jgi:hypothetical protein
MIRYKNIEYMLPEYAFEHILRIGSAEEWKKAQLKPGIKIIEFRPSVDVTG